MVVNATLGQACHFFFGSPGRNHCDYSSVPDIFDLEAHFDRLGAATLRNDRKIQTVAVPSFRHS